MSVEFLGRRREEPNAYRALQKMRKRPTIFLGLGGVGSSAVAKLKELFETTFAGYVEEGKRGVVPDGIQFLCFDSARSERPPGLAAGQEWVRLEATNIDDVLPDLMQDPFYAGWLPEVTGHDYSTGAGGQRALGRLLFTRNVHTFHGKFGDKMRKATSYARLDDLTPLVCVFASLAGGTGSGALLDACFCIRRYHPNARVYAFLGVVDGVASLDQRMRVNATVGTYAALKEIDAFLDDRRLGAPYAHGERFAFPGARAIEGRYDRPFDDCFLVGPENGRGVSNLGDSGRLSSFLARCAFMLTAYTTNSAAGVRSYEAEMCDRKAALEGFECEALARYSVPAIGQLHIPREATADYLQCMLAKRLLTYVEGGDPYPDADAAALVDALELALDRLADAVGRDEKGAVLQAQDWTAVVERELGDKKRRYGKKNREQILGYGASMVAGRCDDHATVMQPQVDAKVQKACGRLYEAVAAALKDARHRLVGALDLLDDVKRLLQRQLDELATRTEATLAPQKRDTETSWANLRVLVDDVCTSGGILDLDAFKVGKAQRLYAAFLTDADARVLQRAKYEQAGKVLQQLLAAAERLRLEAMALKETLAPARTLVTTELERMAAALHHESQGMGATARDICSFSVLDAEWREHFLRGNDQFAETAVLAALCAGDWNPIRWLDIPKAERPAEHLAQDACDRIDDALLGPVRQMGLEQVFAVRQGGAATPADALLKRIIAELTSPQFPIQAMREHLGAPITPLRFIGGVDAKMHAALRSAPEFSDLACAESYEPGMISCLEIHHPVALAGCDLLRSRFHPTYEQWRRELERDKESIRELTLRRFHCFGGSPTWQDPTYHRRRASAGDAAVAQAFAISIMLDPERFDAADPARARIANALAELGKVADAPRERRLGLFKVGRSELWLTPFFDVGRPDGIAPPVRLGDTVSQMRRALAAPEHGGHAARWSAWFAERWSEYFTTDGLGTAIQAAIDEARRLQKQARGGDEAARWDTVARLLADWKAEKVG